MLLHIRSLLVHVPTIFWHRLSIRTFLVLFSSGLFWAAWRNTMSSWRGYGDISSMFCSIPPYTYERRMYLNRYIISMGLRLIKLGESNGSVYYVREDGMIIR